MLGVRRCVDQQCADLDAAAHRVLSRDTGYDRPYGANPYVGYDDVDAPAFLFDGTARRAPAAEGTRRRVRTVW
ncbi:MAG: hypothetical protein R6W77_03200 [Trueperaceae bacterium]